jgi:hypothetical protein
MIRYLLLFDSYCLVLWDALFDERTGLSFVYAAVPRQRSLSRVRVPWDSWPYFTVSDFILPFRRFLRLAGSQWRYWTPPPHGWITSLPQLSKLKSKLCYDRRSVGQSVLVSSTHLGLTTKFLLLLDSCGFLDVGRSLWLENGRAVQNCCWSSPAQLFLGRNPAGLLTIFYCLSVLSISIVPCWFIDVTC